MMKKKSVKNSGIFKKLNISNKLSYTIIGLVALILVGVFVKLY